MDSKLIMKSSLYKAITVKCVRTNGLRYKAFLEGGISITRKSDDRYSINDNAVLAAKQLIDKMGWGGEWVGSYKQDGVYVFVRTDSCSQHKINIG